MRFENTCHRQKLACQLFTFVLIAGMIAGEYVYFTVQDKTEIAWFHASLFILSFMDLLAIGFWHTNGIKAERVPLTPDGVRDIFEYWRWQKNVIWAAAMTSVLFLLAFAANIATDQTVAKNCRILFAVSTFVFPIVWTAQYIARMWTGWDTIAKESGPNDKGRFSHLVAVTKSGLQYLIMRRGDVCRVRGIVDQDCGLINLRTQFTRQGQGHMPLLVEVTTDEHELILREIL